MLLVVEVVVVGAGAGSQVLVAAAQAAERQPLGARLAAWALLLLEAQLQQAAAAVAWMAVCGALQCLTAVQAPALLSS